MFFLKGHEMHVSPSDEAVFESPILLTKGFGFRDQTMLFFDSVKFLAALRGVLCRRQGDDWGGICESHSIVGIVVQLQ